MNVRSTGFLRRYRLFLRHAALAVLVPAALTSCQQIDALTRTSEVAVPTVPGWRVVERMGEVRVDAPGTGDATPGGPADPLAAAPGRELAPGSVVTTGGGGRVIAGRAGQQVAAGTGARLRLPTGAGAVLAQDRGRVRYRIAAPLAVVTPSARVDAAAGVFTVAVDARSSAVHVESGRVRVTMRDGHESTELAAGDSARLEAGDDDVVMLVRRGDGGGFETLAAAPVPDEVMAAMRGGGTGAAEAPALPDERQSRPATAAAASLQEAGPPAEPQARVASGRPRRRAAAPPVEIASRLAQREDTARVSADDAHATEKTRRGTAALAAGRTGGVTRMAATARAEAASQRAGMPDGAGRRSPAVAGRRTRSGNRSGGQAARPEGPRRAAPATERVPADPFERLTSGLLESLDPAPLPGLPGS